MQSLMRHQSALLTECLTTYFTAIWMLTTMQALMSYQIALFTECLTTHFTQIWTLTPLYITGISALITVYMKLFSLSTLVKKKLNFKIYFDRKNKYFIAMCTFIKNQMLLKNCYLQRFIR